MLKILLYVTLTEFMLFNLSGKEQIWKYMFLIFATLTHYKIRPVILASWAINLNLRLKLNLLIKRVPISRFAQNLLGGPVLLITGTFDFPSMYLNPLLAFYREKL